MKYLKKNALILLFLLLACLFTIKIYYDSKLYIKWENNGIEIAKEACMKIQEEELEVDEYTKQECEMYLSGNYLLKNENFFIKFLNLYMSEFQFFNLVACIVLFILSIKGVSEIFRNRVSLLMLKRENYSKFIKKIIFTMYRYVWFWPLTMLLILLVCMINSNFDPNLIKNIGFSYTDFLMNNVFLFVILYLLNIFIFSAIYLNIALIVVRREHNYLLAILESFLLVIAIELFFEIGVNGLFFQIFFKNNNIGSIFNIVNAFAFNVAEYGVGVLFVFSISCLILSSLFVYLSYRNKEKLIIDCEKNTDRS